MNAWTNMEVKFRTIEDPFRSMRADWSQQESYTEYWIIKGSTDILAKRKFETIARSAGEMLSSPVSTQKRFSSSVWSEEDSLSRWLKALREMKYFVEYGFPALVYDGKDNCVGSLLHGSINNVVQSSIQLCFELATENKEFLISENCQLHVDDIDSFSRVKEITPSAVSELLNKGRIELDEDTIQKRIEEILSVSFHKKDWGGEENDLYTTNLFVNGERISTAFSLKGNGTRVQTLNPRDCGKNGDQIIRLFQSPADLFIVQYVGDVSESIYKDMQGKTENKRTLGRRAWFCIINGQDTARLLRAYGQF